MRTTAGVQEVEQRRSSCRGAAPFIYRGFRKLNTCITTAVMDNVSHPPQQTGLIYVNI